MLKTGATGYGIDLSKLSVFSAMEKSIDFSNLSYLVADATKIPFNDDLFTHVLGGCNFGFIQERETSLKECSRVLKEKGKLCISTHFYKKIPPQSILDAVEKAINFRPCDFWTELWWKNFFEKHFHLMNIKIVELPVLDEEIIKNSCTKMIDDQDLKISNKKKYQLIDKLVEIRLTLNNHRNYQSYFQAVFEKKYVR